MPNLYTVYKLFTAIVIEHDIERLPWKSYRDGDFVGGLMMSWRFIDVVEV